jgi:hypothetical protein
METVLYALLAYIWVTASICITHLMAKRKVFSSTEKLLIFLFWPVIFPIIRLRLLRSLFWG